MVNVKELEIWNEGASASSVFSNTATIRYKCGECNVENIDSITFGLIQLGEPYVKCKNCGEVNNTRLKIK